MPVEVENIVGRITQRTEARFGRGAVADVAGLVEVSRSGLTPYDLAQITGLDDLTIAGIRRALGEMVGVTGATGRLRFRHDVMRQVICD